MRVLRMQSKESTSQQCRQLHLRQHHHAFDVCVQGWDAHWRHLPQIFVLRPRGVEDRRQALDQSQHEGDAAQEDLLSLLHIVSQEAVDEMSEAQTAQIQIDLRERQPTHHIHSTSRVPARRGRGCRGSRTGQASRRGTACQRLGDHGLDRSPARSEHGVMWQGNAVRRNCDANRGSFRGGR